MSEKLKAQLEHTLRGTNFGLGTKYEGKVRDVYDLGEQLLIITTDRVSAFDRVLGTIPFKGEILNRMALDGFAATADILPNHVLNSPHPNALLARKCEAYPVEFVMRGYVTGSLWRDLQSGEAARYEVPFSNQLRKDQLLPEPVLTPATKAEKGEHDEPTSRRAILESGVMSKKAFETAEAAARALFERGQARAAARGLILVDTKYELGVDPDGQLVAIDEIHTPDSSRYWVADEYEARFRAGESQRMLDKENLRQWLIATHGFQGHGEAPPLTDDIRITLAQRYIEAFETITGQPFDGHSGPTEQSLTQALQTAGVLAH